MKRVITLITTCLLLLSFVLAMPMTAFAAEDVQPVTAPEHNIMLLAPNNFKNFFEAQCRVLKGMSKEALRAYIEERCEYIEELKKYKERLEKCGGDFVKIELVDQVIRTNLKLAWYAAAQVAKMIGFPCTGILLEHSVLGIPYVEKDGLFALKMRFAGFDDDAFDLDESLDLFFSIHSYTVEDVSETYKLYKVTDTFNFDQEGYENKLADFANNIGKLMEDKGVLLPIPVIVYITSFKDLTPN